MVRPKYRHGEQTAVQKLIAGFWKQLAREDFNRITVTQVCGEAGVNHNTFYYHFTSMSDLATRAAGQALSNDAIQTLTAHIAGKTADRPAIDLNSPEAQIRFDRLCLLAGQHSSPPLQAMLKNSIASTWFRTLGIDPKKLDNTDRVLIEFCLGGAIAVLAHHANTRAHITLKTVADTSLGHEAIATLVDIASRQHK